MALKLGRDGKLRAVDVNTGNQPDPITSLYAGLLTTVAADVDELPLGLLVDDEFAISGTFYTGRLPVSFAPSLILSGVAESDVAVTTVQEWTNSTGGDVVTNGVFITDAASGDVGSVLWVGAADGAPVTIPNGKSAAIDNGDIVVRVD